MPIQRVLCLFGALLLIANSPLSADVLVFDDDFASGYDYSIAYFNNGTPPGSNPDDGSYAEFEINLSGGNPDDALSLMHIHDVDRDENTGDPINGNGETRVFSFLRNTDVSYNPFVEGGFNTVTFSFQYNTSDAGLDSVFTRMRNGAGIGHFAGSEAVVADGNWHTYSQTFTNADFFLMDFSGATNLALQFGFGFESERDVTNDMGEIMMNVNIDNFRVTLSSSVPEPGSLGMFGLVGLAIAGRRRKR